MCSGDKPAFDQVEGVLKDLGENVFHLGALGSGHTIKLINNFFGMTVANAMAEAFAMADVAGVNRKELYDVSTCMRGVLKKERSQNTLDANDLYRLFHMQVCLVCFGLKSCQGITLNKVELQESLDHFDFDMDGKVVCSELTHELLDLPMAVYY